MPRKRPQTYQSQRGNDETVAFYSRIHEQCAAIAALPPSQHDAEIIKLRAETGVEISTIAPIVEKCAHLRVPDYPSLASQLIENVGRDTVRAMLETNYGKRDLTRHVQTTLADERLTITGARVALLIDAIKAEIQPASPSQSIVWGAPIALLR
ncbi:hypothetical protein NWI01_34370 [Nitrobacter winogradskyi]|nr:hypothetical protein NWI01_34370 [Nitrobacter winogradskyi]